MVYYSAIYLNEICAVLPCVWLWGGVRSHPSQKVMDVARTLPLLACLVLLASGKFVGWIATIVVGAYTVLANVAMARLDAKYPPATYSTLAYFASHLSVVCWLAGVGTPNKYARGVVVGLNVVTVAVLAVTVLVALPYMQAWKCYDGTSPDLFRKGYCPQYTGDYVGNQACLFATADGYGSNPRCRPEKWQEFTPLHDVVGLAGHVAFHLLAASFALYWTQVWSHAADAQIESCLLVARTKHD